MHRGWREGHLPNVETVFTLTNFICSNSVTQMALQSCNRPGDQHSKTGPHHFLSYSISHSDGRRIVRTAGLELREVAVSISSAFSVITLKEQWAFLEEDLLTIHISGIQWRGQVQPQPPSHPGGSPFKTFWDSPNGQSRSSKPNRA